MTYCEPVASPVSRTSPSCDVFAQPITEAFDA